MIKTLNNFTHHSLFQASDEFIKKLGLWFTPVSEEPIYFADYYDRSLPNDREIPIYASDILKNIEASYFIGVVNSRYLDNKTGDNSFKQVAENISAEGKYDSILVFACDAKTSISLTRTSISSLTRAFNVISNDCPVILITRQGNKISLSTCERQTRKDGKSDKIGKVTTLLNINCEKPHPGHIQILERIAENVNKSKTFDALFENWKKSFSIDIISDPFFKEYKLIYEDIIEFITGKRMEKVANKWEEHIKCEPCKEIMQEFNDFSNPEKTIRDYVKKLMGRLVFIQFLQKKKWMGCSAGSAWVDGDKDFLQNLFINSKYKDTFVDDVLEPLFNDINTKREGDLVSSSKVGINIKVPYLNGGLFEKDDCDRVSFPLPSRFIKRILDFFYSYNFTIDENAPYDAEIGVDPEMLGRIFENLLEDNKAKGTFYTPKEVVHYMCQESLISYLQSGYSDKESLDSIRSFVCNHDIADLKSDLVYPIDKKLREIKICDPAIGSGAFPMGMLRELYGCRFAIRGNEGDTPSQIKKDIIQNCIYGVDIERGAVDIARLRFWLALIIEEDTPHALPNMDFKIMQGNSLLEQYDGVNLSGFSLNEQTKRKTKKGEAWQQTLAFDEQASLDNIQHAIHEYYGTGEHSKKVTLREIINENVKSYIYNLKGCTPEIHEKLENLPIPNDQFFLWHIYFKEVFDNGGFDIVIGNPPYGVSIKDDYRISVVNALGQVPDYEIYYYFIELSKSLVKDDGILSYIIPNTWLFNTYAKNYRINLFKTWSIDEILDCSKFKIFDADVRNTIIRFHNSDSSNGLVGYRNTCRANSFSELIEEPYNQTTQSDMLAMNQNWGLVFRLNSETISLVNKISRNGNRLESYFPDISQGLIAYDKYQGQSEEIIKTRAYHHSTYHDGLKKMLWGEDITRYSVLWNGKEWIDYCDGIANPREPKFFKGKRLLIREITNPSIFATISEDELYHDPAIIVVLDNISYSLEAALGILNSKVATFYHFNHSPKATKGSFPKILIQDIKDFPLPSIDEETKETLNHLVSQLLSQKESLSCDEIIEIENQIDCLVYKIYNLEQPEICLIESTF